MVPWLDCGGASALLGADMETDPTHGWPAIAERFGASRLGVLPSWVRSSINKAGVAKVSHHGSDGSHTTDVYERFADKNARLLITRNLNPRGRRSGRTIGLPDPTPVDWMIENKFPTYVLGSEQSANDEPLPARRLGWVTMRRQRNSRSGWTHDVHGRADGPNPTVGRES